MCVDCTVCAKYGLTLPKEPMLSHEIPGRHDNLYLKIYSNPRDDGMQSQSTITVIGLKWICWNRRQQLKISFRSQKHILLVMAYHGNFRQTIDLSIRPHTLKQNLVYKKPRITLKSRTCSKTNQTHLPSQKCLGKRTTNTLTNCKTIDGTDSTIGTHC